jgi:aminomuconate-semialdehyde/2-hydroxymuconate-6-semialdehyde dehydrogenase
MPTQVHNHLGGAWRPARDGRTLDDHDPATGALLAQIPRSGPEDVDDAVQAAERAAASWARTSTPERADLLDAIASAIEAHADELALLESLDQGKPVSVARAVDIPRAALNFRHFACAVRQQELGCHPMPGALNYTRREPLGPVALITPWNLPLYLLTWKAAPAIGMGNTVVAKPSELTPLTADALARLFSEVGAPPGVFNTMHGLGPEAGQALIEHPGIKAVSFTGGTATGRVVARTAAPQFKKLSLELGGKNATIVFDDCDLEHAVAEAARAGFSNQGEICLCGSRVLVQRGVYERFVEALVARVGALKVGDPRDPTTQLGALNSLAHRDKVESYLALARQEGGVVRVGGERPNLPAPFDRGAFLTPAVITGLSTSCRTATEEIFGPVVTVHPFDDEQEAVTVNNAVPYGLSASVFTRDLNRAHRVAARLQVGMVWVNTWMTRDLRVPFGGVKHSGVGREGGRWSLEFFSESKNVCVRTEE